MEGYDSSMNLKVLIVDDNQLIAENLKELFELYEVAPNATVCCMPNALEKSFKEDGPYDLYLIDHQFQSLDGLKVTQSFLSNIPSNALLIFMSGNCIKSKVESFPHPHKIFLLKPFQMDEVIKVIEEHMDNIGKAAG